MSRADDIFISMCKDILENGVDTKGEKVRPVWEDGTKAYTIKKFGVVNRYNLAEEFPALTLRKTAIKLCTDEMLWIWQKKSNNIKDLRVMFGMNGLMKTEVSERLTVISLELNINIRKGCLTRLIELFTI